MYVFTVRSEMWNLQLMTFPQYIHISSSQFKKMCQLPNHSCLYLYCPKIKIKMLALKFEIVYPSHCIKIRSPIESTQKTICSHIVYNLTKIFLICIIRVFSWLASSLNSDRRLRSFCKNRKYRDKTLWVWFCLNKSILNLGHQIIATLNLVGSCTYRSQVPRRAS